MEYALYLGSKITASPNAKAFCPHCHSQVTAKCGSKKIWHWAHVASEHCDAWFEPETLWHRQWKSYFGEDFSEIRVTKENSYHIADVVNENGIVFEFQNSPISAETIQAREHFYGERMIWVLNGTMFKSNFLFTDLNFMNQWQLQIMDEFEATQHYSKYKQGILIEDWKVKNTEVKNYLLEQHFTYLAEEQLYYLPHHPSRNKTQFTQKLYAELEQLYQTHKLNNETVKAKFTWQHVRSSWEVSQRPVFIDLGEDHLFLVTQNMGKKQGEGVLIGKEKFLQKYANLQLEKDLT